MESRRDESSRGTPSPDANNWLPEPENSGQNRLASGSSYTFGPSGSGEQYNRQQTITAPVKPRKRWPSFFGGLILGLLLGFFALLVVAIALSRATVFIAGPATDDPDIWISINEAYLNDIVSDRVAEAPVELPVGRVTALEIGFAENQAGMTMTPTFDLDLFTVNVSVDNQLAVVDGQLTATMVGEPRVGNISVPIDVLPFDIGQVVRDGVDEVNRDVLLAELNASFRTGIGGEQFDVVQVNTSSEYLVVKLKRQDE